MKFIRPLLVVFTLFLFALSSQAATPQQCIDWQGICDDRPNSSCEEFNSPEPGDVQCQLVEEGGDNCVAKMSECSNTCFVDSDINAADQYCESTQTECLIRRDSSADDDGGNNYEVLFQYGACGEIPQAGDTDLTSDQCVAIEAVCEDYNNNGPACLSAEVTIETGGVPEIRNDLCQFESLGDEGEGLCLPSLTPETCGNYCYADIDLLNGAECVGSFNECVSTLVDIDPDEIVSGSCNVDNVFVGGNTDDGPGGVTGAGLNATFELQGFTPFQNIEGIYSAGTLQGFVNGLLGFAIGVAGVVTVVMIVIGGFTYVTTAAGAKKSTAKNLIKNSLLGLGLLLISVALLNTINPQLLNLQAIDSINVVVNSGELEDGNTLPGQPYSGGGTAAMISSATYEWAQRWDRGAIRECSNINVLTDYWDNIGFGTWNCADTAWSAAFISYVTNLEGSAHHQYINAAIDDRSNGWGYCPSEANRQVAPGDLVCATRNGDTFDPPNSYASHCDLVVAVSGSEMDVIGGNIGNTVSRRDYELTNGQAPNIFNIGVLVPPGETCN